MGIVGIVTAVLYWVLGISDVLGLAESVRPIVAIAGGVIAAPIWFIWMGVRLLKAKS